MKTCGKRQAIFFFSFTFPYILITFIIIEKKRLGSQSIIKIQGVFFFFRIFVQKTATFRGVIY